jgi:hypothetical protein
MNSLAWLALLVWVAIPLLVILGGGLLWRRFRTKLQKGMVVVASAVLLAAPPLVSNGVKWWFDRQVEELCARDGGIRVYETVTLSRVEFDQLKQVNFVLPDKARAKQTDEYYNESEDYYYRQGLLNVLRMQHRIVRRSDGKVLGESIRYGRVGGDLPGPWHHSSFMCPDPVRQPSSFESSIFLKGEQE